MLRVLNAPNVSLSDLADASSPLVVLVGASGELDKECCDALGHVSVRPIVAADAHNPLLVAAALPARTTAALGRLEVSVPSPAAVCGWGTSIVITQVADQVVIIGAHDRVDRTDVVLLGASSLPRALELALCVRLGCTPRPLPAVDDHVPIVQVPVFELDVDPGDELGSQQFLDAMRKAGRQLPAEVYDAVKAFADAPPSVGALLLKGFDVTDLPCTPEHPQSPRDKSLYTELLLCAVARLLGHPVGYAPELSGKIVQDLMPTQADRYRQVSTSSGSTLDWHTEAAFHPHRPRYLLLLCLRGDPAAFTTLASVRAVLPHLDPAMAELLAQPLFTTRADESYVGGRPTQRSLPQPVITGPQGQEQICFDADLMEGTTPEAAAALAHLAEVTAEHHGAVCLEAGDLLIVDNTLAVHGRSPFTPRFDGYDRWLQRTFVVADLSASAGDRTGRVINTAFLA
jgi:L-asparagine oxygenase